MQQLEGMVKIKCWLCGLPNLINPKIKHQDPTNEEINDFQLHCNYCTAELALPSNGDVKI